MLPASLVLALAIALLLAVLLSRAQSKLAEANRLLRIQTERLEQSNAGLFRRDDKVIKLSSELKKLRRKYQSVCCLIVADDSEN